MTSLFAAHQMQTPRKTLDGSVPAEYANVRKVRDQRLRKDATASQSRAFEMSHAALHMAPDDGRAESESAPRCAYMIQAAVIRRRSEPCVSLDMAIEPSTDMHWQGSWLGKLFDLHVTRLREG